MNKHQLAHKYVSAPLSPEMMKPGFKVEEEAFIAGFDAALEAAAQIGKHIGCEMDSDCRTCRYVTAIRGLKESR